MTSPIRKSSMAGATGFTLIEIMIVVSIIGIIIAIAAPTWFRQREQSRGRACQENLSKINEAKEQYAMEFRLSNGSAVSFNDLITPGGAAAGEGFLKRQPECPAAGNYETNNIGIDPTCSIGSSNDPFASHILP
ncbi:MAG: prepilin-type N-terminal cleavage/methylation domain-containing protein [Candidatus Sumerlaeaceae bacterium]|nr:prepilin-type N-terminal cleavage/methylation domain-containing protein [Candidatus Sumerlaeaceae bacterium]